MDGKNPLHEALDPAIAGALENKGFTTLTPVQLAVLLPAHAGRDLRITSRTGSGKTVAVGLVLRDLVVQAAESKDGIARPRVLVVAPTRELAKQVEQELAWLYAPLRVRVASATGGADYRVERRGLAASPALIVGTPGRLLDHLKRGAIDAGQVGAVVLDEADRMLDMGFRDELEAILAFTPEQRQTHLVSATFPREVQALANRVQRDAVHVEGTRLGEANVDIDHVIHLVDPKQRVDAVINLLLAHPDEETLIFAKTRADVAELAEELSRAGFAIASLSGNLEQAARDRALSAFRRGELRALVATDVAARGIDVVDISRVIQVEPPLDADSYTHRSGRTARAGRKGTSSLLVTPLALKRTQRLLESARVKARFEPIPSAAQIEKANDDLQFAGLTSPDPEGFAGFDERTWALAKRLVEAGDTTRLLARLLTRAKVGGPTAPRQVREILPPVERSWSKPEGASSPRASRADSSPRGGRDEGPQVGYVAFHVSWGKIQGADARRLLAVVCRRGGIRGGDVGTIRVGPMFSVVDVRSELAESFEAEAAKPDPRNPRVKISRERSRTERGKPERYRPSVERPGSDRPATDRPEQGKSERDRPTADKPAYSKPERNKPSVERPTTDKPAYSKPERNRPSVEKPSADRPAYSKPERHRPSVEKPSADRPAYSKPERHRPSVERPTTDKPAYGKPERHRPSVEKPSADRPAYSKPERHRPGAERPATDKPAYGKPGKTTGGREPPRAKHASKNHAPAGRR